MFSSRLGRARWTSRSVVAALVFTLCAAITMTAAAPASALTRERAAKKALAALGSHQRSGSVVVFALPRPVRAGTRVGQARTRLPWKARAAVRAVRAPLVARAKRERAFVFYEDLGPFQPYPHAGRVALVGARSGKVTVSRTIAWPPLVNRRLPAFLTSSKRYRSSRYRVFSRNRTAGFQPPLTPPMPLPASPNSPPQAEGQLVTAKTGSPKNITLTGSDDNGDLLTFHITQAPLHGTLTGQPPNVTYTSDPGYLGPDHFTFKANDGSADSNAGVVKIDVKPTGAAPTVTTSTGCTAYTEKSAAVVVDGQLTVSDPDDTVLDSANVRISANFERGDDLGFVDQNGITASYNDTTGVLNLTGSSSVANYQAALRSVSYRNLSSSNPPATKDVEFTVNDAGSDSAPATKQICITGGAGGANDPPIGETGEGALSYVENDGPVPVDAGFVVGDPDSANLSGATIQFVAFVSQPVDPDGNPTGPPQTVNSFAPAEDELAFVDQNGITGSYDDTTGTLTLSGSASVANYEAAIRSVTYENVSENPSETQRRIRFQVTDSGGASSTPNTRDIFVTAVNDAPVVTTTAGATSYTENDPATPVDSGLTAGDVDDTSLEGGEVRISSGLQSGDSLTFVDQSGISGSYNTGTGVLTLSGSASVADYQAALRSVKFHHAGEDPTTSRTVEFVVSDGDLDSEVASKSIAITPVNDAPVLTTSAGSVSYTEGDPATAVDSGVTVSDVDDTSLESAQVRVSSGFQSGDELVFSDKHGISGSYDSATGVLTLTGTASLNHYESALRSVEYRHSGDDPSASKTVEFKVDDGDDESAAATRDVAVTAVNDKPVLDTTDSALAYSEGDGAVAVDSGIVATDPDSANLQGATVQISANFASGEDALGFADQNGITGSYDDTTGTLTLSGSASVADYQAALRAVTYTNSSDAPSTATRTVTFQANDGAATDNLSDPATRDVRVSAVNDAPVVTASAGSVSYTEGDPATVVDAGLSVSDVDDSSLEGAQVRVSSGFESGDDLAFVDQNGITGSYNTGTGVLTLSGSASVADYQAALRSVEYGHSGDDPSASKTVEFKVDDGDDESAAATRDVAVTTVNDAPVVTTSSGSTTYNVGDDTGPKVDAALEVADADDTSLASAQVRVSSGFESGDDLGFTSQNGISGSYDSATGVLTLSGTASVADYEAALRSVRYRHTGTVPQTPKEVEFKVSDGDADSNAATKAIDVVLV